MLPEQDKNQTFSWSISRILIFTIWQLHIMYQV